MIPSIGKTSKVTVHFEGLKECMEKLRQVHPQLEKKILRKGLRKTGKIILADLKAAAPVDTGLVRQSLKTRAAKRSRRNKNRISMTIGTAAKEYTGDAFYNPILEYGSRKRAPMRWMRNTVEPNEQKYSASLQADIIDITNETINDLKEKGKII